jgi:plasmid stabilization system protein ParE
MGSGERKDLERQQMMELILLLAAEADIQSAFARYEEYQEGRGLVFLQEVELALTLLKANPHLGSPYAWTYRRLLIQNFPYGIFYQPLPSRIIISAVMDLRQDPETMKKRLSE